jgi:L-alanine-DL-glutamate epimerase-like enolase superfamily enzyme
MLRSVPAIADITARVFRIPTDAPEADGTISWDHSTMVLVEASAGGERGLGYTYGAAAAAEVIDNVLAKLVRGKSPLDIPAHWMAMVGAVRNIGWHGIAACAISAVDTALWDLKAKLLGQPLFALLGAERREVPIYGSGGFTSYSIERLQKQLADWVEKDGCRWVKMKIGSEPDEDYKRVQAAQRAIGEAMLFVDANGAYSRKQALSFAEKFAGVGWFEEPVSSDDLQGLRLIRDRAPAAMGMLPANMVMIHSTSAACWRPGPLMCCKRTPHAVAVLLVSSKRRLSPMLSRFHFPPIPRRRCICTSAAQRHDCIISNGFTIMCVSSTRSSTARPFRATA